MLQGQVDTNDFVLMVDVFSVIDEKENSPYPQYEKDIFVEHHKTDNGMIGIIYQGMPGVQPQQKREGCLFSVDEIGEEVEDDREDE